MENFHSKEFPDPLPEEQPFLGQIIWEIFTTIIPAVLIALFVNVFVAEAAEIEAGPSMQPNLYAGYRVMTEKISYYFREPMRGDVVLVERPENEGNLIKRVIGLPGETIEVKKGQAFIDGQLIDEPWVKIPGGTGYPATQIPEGHIFIMGDNRPNSRDSRVIGPVPIESIIGRGWFVYWPMEEFEFLP
jgi:signal peptidase I